ncbi:MAG: hypothetical protein ACT4O0_09185 [Pseudonocardia sp.]
MFRRRREASPAPDAIPWWPADENLDQRGNGQAPPLAAHDPFGGWPAYSDGGTDPVDPILGQHSAGWLPLLTHPIGGQRFQPDVETRSVSTADEDAGDVDRAQPDGTSAGSRSAAVELPEPRPTPAGPAGGRRRPGRRPATAHRRQAPARTTTLSSVEPDTGEATGQRVDGPTEPAAGTWSDPVEAPEPSEASSLAGAFAADYLSWDQDNPRRRGDVLAQYLPSDVDGDAALLGWSGRGRQRAEFALPGGVRSDGEGRVMIDVRVRVTPYRQVGPTGEPSPSGALEVAGGPAVAPAPTARGWKSLDSHWVRMTVPVTWDRGRLVVDTWDEQLGQEPRRAAPDHPGADPSTAEDADTDPGQNSRVGADSEGHR